MMTTRPLRSSLANLILLNYFAACPLQAQLSPDTPLPANSVANPGDQGPAPPVLSTSPAALVLRGGDHQIWQSVTLHTNQLGRVLAKTNSYTALATASSHLVAGQWVESSAEITLTQDGGTATNTAHQASFAPDANTAEAVRLTLPSGETLSSHVLCLSLLDTASGRNQIIAGIHSSIGLLLPGNQQVIYTNALVGNGCVADLLYESGVSGLEQNVILRTWDPTAQKGLNSATTLLQVWTEFVGGPSPAITPLPGRSQSDRGLAATLDDVHLDFSGMTVGPGKAFLIGDPAKDNPPVRVTKEWVVLENRRFLVEQVPLQAIAAQLAALPPAVSPGTNAPGHASIGAPVSEPANRLAASPAPSPARIVHVAAAPSSPSPPNIPFSAFQRFSVSAFVLALPPPPRAKNTGATLHLADASILHKPGFLVDYSILSSQTNLTLFTGQTYLINGTVNVGTLVIMGGAVVKFAETNNATIIATNVLCLAKNYLPAVFTSKNDSNVGDPISDSTGITTNYAASIALDLSSATNPILSHLRFSYLSNAVAASSLTLQDVQFLNCRSAVAAGSLNVALRNILADHVQTFIDTGGEGYIGKTVSGENLTVSQCGNFLLDTNGAIALTNVLFVAVTNWQCLTTATNTSAFLDSGPGVFTASGAGNFYLATNTYRGVASTNISAALLAELRQKTTWPPAAIYSNVVLSGDTIFSPQVPRETNALDIGYAYNALDYIFSGSALSNGTFTVQQGTVIGAYPNNNGYALAIYSGCSLQSAGTATNPVLIVTLKTVQEQPFPIRSGSFQASVMTFTHGATTLPQAAFNFTKWYTVGAEANHYYGYVQPTLPISVRNCEFYGGGFVNTRPALAITNCLFDSVSIYLAEDFSTGFDLSLFNNLFHRGDFTFAQVFSTSWIFRDNVFDYTTIGNYDAANIVDHNAYIGITNYLTSTPHTGDVFLTNFTWITGPLGSYYQVTNSPFFDKGSRSAGLAGFFDWTVTTNLVAGLEIPENNTKVDLGLHYVAVDANTNCIDSNSNGIPNYLENPDTNNNGLPDYWEIQYFTSLGVDPGADPDFDGLTNLQEYQGDTIPTSSDPPAVSVPPQSQTVFAGTNVTFTVTPTGSVLTNYTFQWRKSSQPIPGATNITLVLSNVTFADSANYSVVVSNIAGRVTSRLARLTVWTPGTIAVWGRNDYGQTNIPLGLTNVVGVGAGFHHSYALKSDGTVIGWGSDDPVETNTPAGLADVAEISVKHYHNIALINDGTVATWGWPDTTYGVEVPAGAINIVSVAANSYSQLALRSDGMVLAWGGNTYGETTVPAGLSNVVAIAAGATHNLAVKSDGTVVSWGDDSWAVPSVPVAATNAVAAFAGYQLSGIIRKDGTALIWGDNTYGELTIPGAATNLAVLSSAWQSLMALRRDGTVFAWGLDDYGQADIPPLLNPWGVSAISAGDSHSLAIFPDSDGDGLPDAWELFYFGNLGTNGGSDPDGDGLTNLQEFQQQTNPNNQDSDGDGVIDQAFKVIIARPTSNSNLP